VSRLSSTDTPTEGEVPNAEEPAAATDEARAGLLEALTGELGEALVGSHLDPGDDLWVRVERGAWVHTGEFLKTGLGFQYFSFLSAIDWLPSPFGRDMDAQVDLRLGHAESSEIDQTIEQGVAGGDTRFQVFARVNDIVNGLAVTLKCDVPDDDLSIDSWVPVYAGANWHERECREMYGIDFVGHPGLRNIYLPAEFEGNPLRKDYPLLARRMKPWPGIVDVEKMPGEDDADEATEEGSDS
jgi:NADH-quinone oxidoreductase subunit C